jgi:hypothetical protein
MKRDVANDTVALVEDGENADALRHWSHPRLVRGSAARRLLSRNLILLRAAVARRQRERDRNGDSGLEHVYSGIHGS